MTVLRRITSDWRVAAIAKFGYAFLSSLAIVVVFFLITLGGDLYFRLPFLTTCFGFLHSNVYSDTVFRVHWVGGLVTFCWSVFWTGIVSQRFVAIFLSFLCSIVMGVITTIIAIGLMNKFIFIGVICQLVIGLTLLLISAPICKRAYRVE